MTIRVWISSIIEIEMEIKFLRNIYLSSPPVMVKMTFLYIWFLRPLARYSFFSFLSFREDERAIKRLFTRNQRQNRLFVQL